MSEADDDYQEGGYPVVAGGDDKHVPQNKKRKAYRACLECRRSKVSNLPIPVHPSRETEAGPRAWSSSTAALGSPWAATKPTLLPRACAFSVLGCSTSVVTKSRAADGVVNRPAVVSVQARQAASAYAALRASSSARLSRSQRNAVLQIRATSSRSRIGLKRWRTCCRRCCRRYVLLFSYSPHSFRFPILSRVIHSSA